ncbi:MAG: sensor histidine kinase [Candidatus Levyibacteriota bacterium]
MSASATFQGATRWLERPLWRSLALLLGAITALALYSMPSQIFNDGPGWAATPADWARAFGFWWLRYPMWYGPVLVAVAIADRLPLSGGRRVAALVAAVLVGAQVQWPLTCVVDPPSETACELFATSPFRSWLEMLPAATLGTAGWSSVFALAWFSRQRDRRIAQALHAAELARAQAQRNLLEAELQTMRARVDPPFLLDALGEVGERFDAAPADGERMLDDLIHYLRAALPSTPTTTSTLRQEAELAQAWLALLRTRCGGRLDSHVGFAPEIADARMPPMTLLPLLVAALDPACGRAQERGAVATAIGIDVLRDEGRIRIAVTGRGPGLRAAHAAAVQRDVRARLQALYGDRAALTLRVEDGRSLTSVLEIPHEDAQGSARRG